MKKVLAVRPRIIVCGGGASGYAAAISAKQCAHEIDVICLESASRPLKKVLISGGGRCNVMHNSDIEISSLVENYPRGKRELLGPFTKRWGPQETRAWFEETLGVELKLEDDGRMFPKTDDARTVTTALESAAQKNGVQVHFKEPVQSITKQNSVSWSVSTKLHTYVCEALILCTGSAPAGYRFAQDLGHKVHPPYPSLFSFRLAKGKEKNLFSDLAGISLSQVLLSLQGTRHKQQGPLLLTHNGLSGPAALRLSAFAARDLAQNQYCGTLCLSTLPHLKNAAVLNLLQEHKFKASSQKISSKKYRPFADRIPYRFWLILILLALDHTKPTELRWADLSKIHLTALANALTDLHLPFDGKDTNKDEFVTAGGVSLSQVDIRTMASKVQPGLFFAGELLDIDAVTGGFNFQHCWTSGHIAGSEAAAFVLSSSSP